MKNIFLILIFIGSKICAQNIPVKQIVGALQPQQNVSIAGQSSFIPSFVWDENQNTQIRYPDGTNLFYIHDTLFCIGGFNGFLTPSSTDSIHYSTDFGKTWGNYWVKFPYAYANVTTIKARYPGGWNYVFGETGSGGHQATVTRFKDLQNFITMTTTAEYGNRVEFGATQDIYGNLYVVGGQTDQDTTTCLKDLWMSTAQSGGTHWTQVQSGITWLGGSLINQVVERNGYLYVLKYGDKFGGGGGTSAYSNKNAKISIADITDKTRWRFLDTVPNVLGLFTASAVYKGNIFLGLGNYQNTNKNFISYLDPDDHWHVLQNFLGVDSASVIQPNHATDMIVIGGSLYVGIGNNALTSGYSSTYRLHDTSYASPHFIRNWLGVRKSAYLSQPINSYELILANGVVGSSSTGDSMIRVHSADAPYMVQSKTDGTWWGLLTSSNSTQNVPAHIATGRKLWLDGTGVFNINTPVKLTASVVVGNGSLSASSVNFTNSTDNQGYIEYNAAAFDHYFQNAIKFSINANGARLPAGQYLNFGSYAGTSGYGIRDNAGSIEFKNSGGAWVGVGSSAAPALTQNYIGLGDATNHLTGSSNFTFNGQVLNINHATAPVIRVSVNGTAVVQSEFSTSSRDIYSYPYSRYIRNEYMDGKIVLNPDATTYSGGATAFKLNYGAAEFPFLHVGNGSLSASSVNFTNSTDNQGYIEYNAAAFDHYFQNAIKFSINANGARLPAGQYLNFGSSAGTSGYGIRDNAGSIEFKNSGGNWQSITDTLSKAITIESPSTSESKTLWFTKKAITLVQINDVLTGSSTPSVTWNIKYASTRNAASPTAVFSSDRATTSTSGASTTTFANASIPAGSWIWLTTSANAGTVTDLNITLTYTQ